MDSTSSPVAPSGALEKAVACRLCQLHAGDIALDPAAVDCQASFFAPAGFYMGDHVLDSLDIVEMIVALEVDFKVSIVNARDVTQYDSIAKLSGLLEEVAGKTERESFEAQWCA